jgi:hypothetical protein
MPRGLRIGHRRDMALAFVRGSFALTGQSVTLTHATAVSAVVSWIAPTLNTDGSALTGGDAIDHYRVEWGTVINAGFGVFINSENVTAPTTTLTLTDLPPMDYAFQVIAVAVDGEESNPQFIGTKTVT